MVRIWPIHHCVCHPVCKLPHWTPVIKPPQRCFPQQRIRTLKRLCSCLQYSVLAFLFIIIVLLVGRQVEERHVERAQSTLDLYTRQQVCALVNIPRQILNETSASSIAQQNLQKSSPFHGDQSSNSNNSRYVTSTDSRIQTLPNRIQTLPNISVARTTPNTLVAHCGDCGKCSSPQDVLIYEDTKNTLTDTTTKCAKLALIGGRRRATKCMQERVGLSEACTECWVDNIICTVKSCAFTCLWRQMTSWGESKSVGGELNECTKCDELRCGRAFLTCAGANRRRTGIISDIERDFHQEVCTDADEAFWRNKELRLWYESTEVTSNASIVQGNTRLLRC